MEKVVLIYLIISKSNSENEYPVTLQNNYIGAGYRGEQPESKTDTDLTDYKKMFEKNENMMDMMTEDLMSLKEIMSAQNKLGLFERILLSAKMVKTVLVRNMELNKDYMDHTLMIDDLQKQIRLIQFENESLRERLGMLENMTGTDSYYIAMNFSTFAENIPEMARNKKMSNKFIQIRDTMSSTAYTSNVNALNNTQFPEESRRNSRDMMITDQTYSLGARCSTSPKINKRNADAEPVRCIISGHEVPNMNLSYYPKPPLQLEPIKNVKIKQFGNRREARINDSQKIRNFESLKTSFMNYEQMNSPSHISSNKRPTTRTLASIRNKNLRLAPTATCNSKNKLPHCKHNSSMNRTANEADDSMVKRYKTEKSGSKSKMKNYRRLINYYQ